MKCIETKRLWIVVNQGSRGSMSVSIVVGLVDLNKHYSNNSAMSVCFVYTYIFQCGLNLAASIFLFPYISSSSSTLRQRRDGGIIYPHGAGNFRYLCHSSQFPTIRISRLKLYRVSEKLNCVFIFSCLSVRVVVLNICTLCVVQWSEFIEMLPT